MQMTRKHTRQGVSRKAAEWYFRCEGDLKVADRKALLQWLISSPLHCAELISIATLALSLRKLGLDDRSEARPPNQITPIGRPTQLAAVIVAIGTVLLALGLYPDFLASGWRSPSILIEIHIQRQLQLGSIGHWMEAPFLIPRVVTPNGRMELS